MQLPDADPAVCQVLVLGLPCGQQRLGGLKGLGKPLLSLRFRRGQGVKRGLGRLHVWLSADDVLILPELSPGRLRVQLRLADCFPEAGQLFQQLLVPVHLGGEVLEFGPCRLDPLSGVLGVSEAVCKVAGVLVLALQLLQLQGLSVALPVIFLGLGVLVLGLPYHFGKQGLGTLQRPDVRLAGCYVMDSFVHLFGQHHVLIQQLILFADLLAQDVDALLEGGDGAALLRSGRLGDVPHPAVDVQAQERGQDLHAPVAVGVQEEAVGVLPDEGDTAKGVAVHTEQPLNAGLGQFHGGVALICPGVPLRVPPLEGQGTAPALGPGADDPVVLPAQGKGKGDAAALRPVADPAADVLFPGLLIEAVRDGVHEEGGLADTVLAVHHCHVYRGEVKGRLRVAPVVLDLNRPGHKCSSVFAVLASIVGLLDDRRGQLHEAGRFLACDVVGLQPA